VKEPERFGVPEIRSGKIIRVEENQRNEEQLCRRRNYLYDHNIFDAVRSLKPSARGELEISDAHTLLINVASKLDIQKLPAGGKTPESRQTCSKANRLILDNIEPHIDGNIDKQSDVAGRVVIEKGAHIIKSKFVDQSSSGKIVYRRQLYRSIHSIGDRQKSKTVK